MSYFDDASLVMIPSGTKTSKVYSVKPIDGSGDLTFTRSNDTATRVASNGLIEKVRTNLALRSQSFATSAVWATANGTITNNAGTAPDGTNTASKIVATDSDPFVYQALTLSGSVVASCYVKGIGSSIGKNGSIRAASTIINFTITGDWQRVSVAHTAGGAQNYGVETPEAAAVSDEVLLWGFQVEYGDVATDYIATTSAAVSVGPVANVPRLDYLNSSCPKLILEPQRQNLLTFSESFDNAAWAKTNVSVTANSIASPDGYTNADTLAGNGSAGIHIIQQIIAAYGANDTISIFAKKGTNNFIQIYTDFVNTDYANFNLNTGVVGDKGATTGATTITDYGNGWYRCTMVTGSALSGNVNIALISSATSARAETNSLSTNLYIYGAQLESGDYATSYIPTLGSASTRGVDLAVDTAASSLIGQTEGTIYAEVNFDSNVNTEGYIVRLDDTSFNDTIIISRGNDKRLNTILRAGGSTIVNIQQDNFNGLKRVAFAYKSGSFAVYVDGVQVGTSAATYTNGITYGEVRIGGFDASTANMSGGISKVLLFKTRLPNSQLAELTSL